MEENKRGGKRLGAGRKSIGNSKKRTIALYVPEKQIWLFGNQEKLKTWLYRQIDSYEKSLDKPTNEPKIEVKPPVQSEVSKVFASQNKPFKTLEQYKKEKQELETEEDYNKWLAELKADLNFSDKQKALIINYN